MVDTIRLSLQKNGYFIGTTIDGEKTKELLTKNNGYFEYENGYIKWADENKKIVEIYMKDSIMGIQHESLVDFKLLSNKLKDESIMLESTNFFKQHNDLTSNENQLNALYRTFVFRKIKDTIEEQKVIDTLLEPVLNEKDNLVNHVMKRLSMTTYKNCVPLFHQICKFPSNLQNPFNFSFNMGKSYIFSGSIVSNCKDFKNGLLINSLTLEIPNFLKTFGCIPYENKYLLVKESLSEKSLDMKQFLELCQNYRASERYPLLISILKRFITLLINLQFMYLMA